ncbi:MFS transporter [Altererythrobacter salegens]|uniref:MFS transporter n=1 Tax=Croceibacterium salegens TaxID=1737568 RepID=A0A6I4T0V7_9SPHN|nr:MFS transporter [Croceibacterium salegens]MXO60887.1 MFS transporter [Croceibacterium salegens]
MASDAGAPRRGVLARIFAAQPHEMPAVGGGFALFFLLFTSYFMLRPVRETFGIAGGVDNLQWLFTGTFVGMLVVVPLYGWLSRKLPRRLLLYATYGFSAAVMTGFAFSLWADPDNVWVARAFYIWLSVFNQFVISIAWSFLADVFDPAQAKRLFGQVAAGASLGGLTGPLLSAALVAPLGHAGLLLLSTALLLATLGCVAYLQRWAGARYGETGEAAQPIGGSIFAGLTLIARTPYLQLVSVFVLLLTMVTTFLYMEQARIVEATFPDPVRQTQVFGTIDAVVQALTIGLQLLATGRLAKKLGVTVLLVSVPLMMVAGFGVLTFAATFPVFVAVMIVRRVGEYAFARPGREMVFASVGVEEKYKAKNVIDTVVYRTGDLVGAWSSAAITALASSAAAAVAGAVTAALWALVGWTVGRRTDRGAAGASVNSSPL